MPACINHDDHAAIEFCEICRDPLCDLCLWYDDDGRRLCERHARELETQGIEVHSPALYEEGIRVREVEPHEFTPPYQGNDTDLMAALALLFGAASVAQFFGFAYCMPVLALVLGFAALTSRKAGLDPTRSRTMSIFGISLSVISFLPFVFFFCMFAFVTTLGFVASNGGP
jgi:hypothetical protein